MAPRKRAPAVTPAKRRTTRARSNQPDTTNSPLLDKDALDKSKAEEKAQKKAERERAKATPTGVTKKVPAKGRGKAAVKAPADVPEDPEAEEDALAQEQLLQQAAQSSEASASQSQTQTQDPEELEDAEDSESETQRVRESESPKVEMGDEAQDYNDLEEPQTQDPEEVETQSQRVCDIEAPEVEMRDEAQLDVDHFDQPSQPANVTQPHYPEIIVLDDVEDNNNRNSVSANVIEPTQQASDTQLGYPELTVTEDFEVTTSVSSQLNDTISEQASDRPLYPEITLTQVEVIAPLNGQASEPSSQHLGGQVSGQVSEHLSIQINAQVDAHVDQHVKGQYSTDTDTHLDEHVDQHINVQSNTHVNEDAQKKPNVLVDDQPVVEVDDQVTKEANQDSLQTPIVQKSQEVDSEQRDDSTGSSNKEGQATLTASKSERISSFNISTSDGEDESVVKYFISILKHNSHTPTPKELEKLEVLVEKEVSDRIESIKHEYRSEGARAYAKYFKLDPGMDIAEPRADAILAISFPNTSFSYTSEKMSAILALFSNMSRKAAILTEYIVRETNNVISPYDIIDDAETGRNAQFELIHRMHDEDLYRAITKYFGPSGVAKVNELIRSNSSQQAASSDPSTLTDRELHEILIQARAELEAEGHILAQPGVEPPQGQLSSQDAHPSTQEIPPAPVTPQRAPAQAERRAQTEPRHPANEGRSSFLGQVWTTAKNVLTPGRRARRNPEQRQRILNPQSSAEVFNTAVPVEASGASQGARTEGSSRSQAQAEPSVNQVPKSTPVYSRLQNQRAHSTKQIRRFTPAEPIAQAGPSTGRPTRVTLTSDVESLEERSLEAEKTREGKRAQSRVEPELEENPRRKRGFMPGAWDDSEMIDSSELPPEYLPKPLKHWPLGIPDLRKPDEHLPPLPAKPYDQDEQMRMPTEGDPVNTEMLQLRHDMCQFMWRNFDYGHYMRLKYFLLHFTNNPKMQATDISEYMKWFCNDAELWRRWLPGFGKFSDFKPDNRRKLALLYLKPLMIDVENVVFHRRYRTIHNLFPTLPPEMDITMESEDAGKCFRAPEYIDGVPGSDDDGDKDDYEEENLETPKATTDEHLMEEARKSGHVPGTSLYCVPEGGDDEDDDDETSVIETPSKPPPRPTPAHATLPGASNALGLSKPNIFKTNEMGKEAYDRNGGAKSIPPKVIGLASSLASKPRNSSNLAGPSKIASPPRISSGSSPEDDGPPTPTDIEAENARWMQEEVAAFLAKAGIGIQTPHIESPPHGLSQAEFDEVETEMRRYG